MSSFKRLNKADVTTVLYTANKQWNLTYSGTPNDDYIKVYLGRNNTNLNTLLDLDLIYANINHCFYQAYTSSLNTGSIMFNVETYESASQQRPTSSYFNYNNNPLLIKQFPTGSSELINVISINRNTFGSKILPNSFIINRPQQSTLNYPLVPQVIIKDDGYGNLYDIGQAQNLQIDLGYITLDYFETGNITGNGIFFVGNIFYAHGTIIITNSNYIDLFSLDDPFDSTISFQNEHRIYENEVRCIVKESDFNLTYNPSLLKYGNQVIVPISGSATNGYTTTGSFDNSTIKDFATGSLEFSGSFSIFRPYVTTIGLYNDNNELLMVAKLAKPIMLSPDTDTTFIVKYDT
jgi:hypothetical protein